MDQQVKVSDQQIFTDVTEFISVSVISKRLWKLYVEASGAEEKLTEQSFFEATQQIVPDLLEDEKRVLSKYFFSDEGFLTLQDLAVQLRIPHSELVKREKTKEATIHTENDEIVKAVRTELEEEIEKLFYVVDINQNGWLDQKELHDALVCVGINPAPDDIVEYFRSFDKNSDEKISLTEFEIVFKDMLIREWLHAEELVEDIRHEFKLICNPNSQEIQQRQVRQIFEQFNIPVTIQEIQYIFNEIDTNQSGSVDLEELLAFFRRDFNSLSKVAQNIMIRIRGSRHLTLKDLQFMFEKLPSHYFCSFFKNQNRRLENLPSCFLKPKIDKTGLIYDDLKLVEAQKYNLELPLLSRKYYKPKIYLEAKFFLAEGVPIPENQDINWSRFLEREVGIGVFDRITRQFKGNVIYVPCFWDPKEPDVWQFKEEYTVYISYNDYDDSVDSQLELIFEFIGHLDNEGYVSPISICFGAILFSNLKVGDKQQIILQGQGGSPFNILNIDPKDIRSKVGYFKKKKNNTKMEYQFLRIKDQNVISDLATLPARSILPKNWLKLIRSYREYIAYMSIKSAQNYRIKSFMNAVDVPGIADSIAKWWDMNVEKKKLPHTQQMFIFNALCEGLYVMLQRSDFKFRIGDPTKMIDHIKPLRDSRQICIAEFFQDLSIATGDTVIAKRSKNYFEMEPMHINEMLQQEDEEEIRCFEKLMKRMKKVE